MKNYVQGCLALLVSLVFAAVTLAEPALIPWPKAVQLDGGRLEITGRIVATDPALAPLAKVLSGDIERMAGVKLATATGAAKAGDIVLKLDPALHGEAHKLDAKDTITITGGNYRAVVWGTSTLLQLIDTAGGKLAVPTGSIADDSDIKVRSAECDIARKWHPIVNLYELIDLFRFYKINHIQFHLNDHGMHTFGTELFPDLPTVTRDGQKRHYTKGELKALIAYAKDRGVSVIPELEMPGHTDAHRIYPKVFGTKDPATGEYKQGPYININRDDTVEACKKMLNEVMDVFDTAEYVSIGADEVADGQYAKLAEYAEFKQKHPDMSPFANFLKEMNDCAKSRGRKLLVYGRGGPPDVLQMPWSGNDNNLAQRGYQIMPHNSGSVTQHLVTFHEPPYNTIMLYSGFQSSYEFDFTNDKKIAPENYDKVFGIHTLTWQHWHFMHFFDLRRQMAAIGENAWNHNSKDKFIPFAQWRDTRWKATDARLDDLVFPVKVQEQGLLSPGKDIVFTGQMTVTLSSPRKGTIRYHMEKLDFMNPPPLPTKASPVYSGPITITSPTVIYAALFDAAGNRIGYGTERRYWPITPVATCTAYNGVDIAKKLDQFVPNLAQPSATSQKKVGLPNTLEELEKVGVEPAYRNFPMGRLTYHPSYEGVYQNGWLLVFEGTIKVPADGEYVFWLAPIQSNLYIDGRSVATVAGEGKNAARTGEPVKLTAGEHSFKWLAATGSKYRGAVVTVRKPGEDEKAGVPLEQWMVPLKTTTAAN